MSALDYFNDTHQMVRETVRKFVEREILPHVDIMEAFMEGSVAFITVKFISEQVNVVRDGDDNVVSGEPNTVVEVTDFWTFSRDTKSRDPNWSLVATRSLD